MWRRLAIWTKGLLHDDGTLQEREQAVQEKEKKLDETIKDIHHMSHAIRDRAQLVISEEDIRRMLREKSGEQDAIETERETRRRMEDYLNRKRRKDQDLTP